MCHTQICLYCVSRLNTSTQINTCCTDDLYNRCWSTSVDTTSLTAEAWHHFLKINHDIIAELTQPLSLGCIGTVQASASPWRGHVTFVLWDPVDLHTERGKTRLLLLLLLCRAGRSCISPLSSLLSALSLCCVDADGSTNNPPSLSPLHPSRPLLLTHQRQCTVYSLPAATMETGVVVYDSERLVCREIDRKRDTQRQGKGDKERDLLNRSVNQWLHEDGINSPSFEGTMSCISCSDVSSLMFFS